MVYAVKILHYVNIFFQRFRYQQISGVGYPRRSSIRNKRESRPAKKHGSIPL